MVESDLSKKLYSLLVKEAHIAKRRLYELYLRENELEKSRLSCLASMYQMKFHQEESKRKIENKTFPLIREKPYDFTNMNEEIQLYEIKFNTICGELKHCRDAVENVEKMLEKRRQESEVKWNEIYDNWKNF